MWFQSSVRNFPTLPSSFTKNIMTETNKTGNPSAMPVIYVHAKGSDRATDRQILALAELGLPLCSRIANNGMVKTEHGFDRPGLLLAELCELFPGRPVIFLRAGLQPSKQMLDRLVMLLEPFEQPLALTLLCNADTAVNPFVGLQPPANGVEFDFTELVKLLAPGQLHTLTAWTDHFVLLSSKAVDRLARENTTSTLMQRLTVAGGKLKVADHLFLHDPASRVFEPLKLHPHESPQPPPFSELSARLQDWYNAGISRLPYNRLPERPATLHITHSWGGGVASWLKSFTMADNRRVHYQLRSEEARAGLDFGQKLSLYARNELRCPIASWWLQPAIPSLVDNDEGYKEILAEICLRYGIGRIFVSSLIGHSLDALRSGLATVQILHDHFPVWPLLSVNPEPYLAADGGVELEKALREHGKSLKFLDKDATAWLQIQRAYLEALNRYKVRVAAPGRWVLDLQNRLEPAFRELKSKIIPHGFPALADVQPIMPRARKDGRLRMVILGRMQPGKGQNLLSRALPGLIKHVQVYLLGTGKSGESFFGRRGVDVVLEYDRDKLGALLAAIGPDFAALLSVVPETFSYTLSELQQLRIPAIATRVGSFPDRIDHGKTGWLINADPGALVRQVAALCLKPAQIASVRLKLPGSGSGTPKQMASAYNSFCPLPAKMRPFTPVKTGTQLTQWAAADYRRSITGNELRRAKEKQEQLAQEVSRRSEWALKTDRQLQLERSRGEEWLKQNRQLTLEVETRTEWAQATSEELKQEQQRREQWVAQLNTEIGRLKKELESRTKWAQKTNQQLKLERSRGKQWVKQNKQLSMRVERRTAWAQTTDKELKLEQRRREKWVAQLNTEIGKLNKELESRTEWAEDTNKQLKLERARGKEWVKQNRQLGEEVEIRTRWAQKTSEELKQEQRRREKWVAQLNTEIGKLNKELESRTEWAVDTNKQLKLERARGKEWVKQNRQLGEEVEIRTRWAQKTSEELKQEQQRRDHWVAQLNTEIGKLNEELESRTEWAQKASKELKLEQQRRELWVAQLNTEISELSNELENRTEWALNTNRELEQEQRRREKWVGQLESEISRLQLVMTNQQAELDNKNLELENLQVKLGKSVEILEDRQSKLENKQAELEHTRSELNNRQVELENTRTEFDSAKAEIEDKKTRLQRLESDFRRVSELNALIVASSSWKITRPLRALRRLGKKFMQARAWNPARWPWLLSHLVKNLSTLGYKESLRRMQSMPTGAVPASNANVDRELPDASAGPDAFQFYEQPDASIVIPVYNKWNYTAACLNSLLETRGAYTFEVIVVDDQSSDETADELARIKGIKHLRNEQNLGFVGSCNRGAKNARGEYLVLLNNDTQVMKGWLDELIETFKREPQAGLVGSRLVYPDGSLQESGGIIFNDGSGWNYGRGQDAQRPEYLFLREADYCSGACIALKTGFFHQIGGLDERYAPAYYEDTDLAFKVREYGLKVLVQPFSVVVHHEGVTSGTDTSSGTKKYQLINQKKFLQRWQTQLASQPDQISNPDDTALVRDASHHRCKGQILFIDATTPEPDQDSGSVRLTNLLKICRDLGYDVTFFADNRAYMDRYTHDLQKAGIEVLYNPWLDALQTFFEERGGEYDYVFISRHYIAINYVALLKRYCTKARFIFDTVDLHYLREQRLAELEKSKTLKATARQTRRSELSVIKEADATLVVSSVEKAVLAEDAPGNKVHVLSNIHHVPGRSKGFAERKDIYFIGGYQHPPNIDAACWFVNDIWPLIHEHIPEMRFHLIGSKAPEQVSSLHGYGVVFHGFVESLESFLSGCRMAVAPLRYGAGVKGKVNMSMAHGQPVVATSVAGEGMFAEHEREFLIADDAEAFAREVVRLYQDEALWYRLSDASIRNVEEHFSVTAARNSFTSLLDSFTNT